MKSLVLLMGIPSPFAVALLLGLAVLVLFGEDAATLTLLVAIPASFALPSANGADSEE